MPIKWGDNHQSIKNRLPMCLLPLAASTTPALTDDSIAVDKDKQAFKAATPNIRPAANAGRDFQVQEGETITLSGSASDRDGDILSYSWTQNKGSRPRVVLADTTTLHPYVVAPLVNTDTKLTFRLVVKDNKGGKSRDDVVVTIKNAPPPPATSNQQPATSNQQNQ